MLKILLDADMLVFRACAACETPIDWDIDCTTLHCEHAAAEAVVDNTVLTYVDKVLNHLKYEGVYEIIMCFSDSENFRKKILPTYNLIIAPRRPPSSSLFIRKTTTNFNNFSFSVLTNKVTCASLIFACSLFDCNNF